MPRNKAAVNGGPAVKKPRVQKGAHKLPPPLPQGEVLTDSFKKQWIILRPIGSGGFGLIYLAGQGGKDGDQYVVKVEPHDNGPLFCELHFYMRVAKPDMIDKWKTSHKLKTLGMPKYIGSGSHHSSGVRYRFMVMERFGTDLQKLFEANGKKFPSKTVYQIALRLIDTLEYINDNEYVHADIKASNLLQGCTPGTQGQVFLVDYGLAFRYSTDGKHKEYKEDPRRLHDGTIEFTSRDSHRGVAPSRRGDMEILGYCLLQWLCSTLPWEDNLNNKDYVAKKKFQFMDDIPAMMPKCLPAGTGSDAMTSYLQYVAKLGYEQRPDYSYLRKIFKDALKKEGYTDDGKLVLEMNDSAKATKTTKATPKRGKKRLSGDDVEESPPKVRKQVRKVLSPKSPKSPSPRSSAPRRVKSPEVRRPTPAMLALQRAKSPEVRRPTPAMLALQRAKSNSKVVGSPAKPTGRKRGIARVKDSASVATQTSPGLKGLKRSRKQ